MHTLNRWSILSAALIISLFSCSKNETNPDKDPPVIEIKIPDVTLPEISDGSTTANFTVSAPWTLEMSNTRTSPDWLTVSPTSGEAGDVTLTITTTEANEDYDDRNAYLKIKAGSVTKIITVTQKKKEALLLSKDRYEISPEGGRFSVEVKSNVSYQVTIDENCKDWLSQAVESRSLQTSNVHFSVSSGSFDENRQGTIIFNSENLNDTVYVYQTRKDGLILTQRTKNINASAQSFDVELRSNIEYEVIIQGGDWLRRVETRAMRVDRVSFSADENIGYDNRTLNVIFKDKNSALADTLTVTQAQKNALILSEKRYTVGPESSIINVELQSNTDYNVVMPENAGWITELKTKGLETYNHKFNIAAYEGQAKRSAFVLFRDEANSMTDTLFITQNGSVVENPYIKIKYPYEDFDGFIVKKDGGIINFEIDANVEYKLSMSPKDSTWIKEKSKTGDKYEFYIAKNLSQQMILGHIFVENQHYQLKDTILIGLLPNVDYYIHIPKTTYDIPWRGNIEDSDCPSDGRQKFDIPFSTNDEFFEYEVDFKGERWGDVNADERKNGHEEDWVFHVTINKNILNAKREMQIRLYTIDNTVKKTITIRQAAAPEGYPEKWNITVEADQLRSVIRECEAGQVKELQISGSLSENDLSYINAMEKLEKLDLSRTNLTRLELSGWMLPALKTVQLPAGLQILGLNTFYGCTNLKNIILPEGLQEIGQRAFYNSGLETVRIPASVRKIGTHAFAASALTSVHFQEGSSLQDVGDGVFSTCSSLVNVYGNLNTVGQSMFYNCMSLKLITLAEGIEYISTSGFEGASALEVLSLPGTLNFLFPDAFKGCTSLTAIYAYSPTGLDMRSFPEIFGNVNAAFKIYFLPDVYSELEENDWGLFKGYENHIGMFENSH